MSQIICPVRPPNFTEFEALVSQVDNRADMVEVWLDQASDDFFEKFATFDKTGQNFLAVCKRPEEKGLFAGDSVDRVARLQKFLLAGGNFVDLDITQNELVDIKSIDPEKLILSFHDFERVPGDLETLFAMMKDINPAIYKFAVTVENEKDYDRFMAFVEDFPKDKKSIFTTMGKFGAQGRKEIGEKSWGQFFSLDEKSKTASGQRTLDEC